MKKAITVMLCALLLCFAFTSCKNTVLPGDFLPGFGEDGKPSLTEEGAAVSVSYYVDELDLVNIEGVAKALAKGYISNAVEVGLEYLTEQAETNGYDNFISYFLSIDDYPGFISQLIDSGILKQIVGTVNSDNYPDIKGNYSMYITDYDLPDEEGIKEIYAALTESGEDTAYPDKEWPFSITVAVAADEMNNEIFHDDSAFSYKGIIYLTVNGAFVNDEQYGDFYLHFDSIVADTKGHLIARASETDKDHKIEIEGVTADLGWDLDIENISSGNPDISIEPADAPLFTPTTLGFVKYDGVRVPFADVLPYTNNF